MAATETVYIVVQRKPEKLSFIYDYCVSLSSQYAKQNNYSQSWAWLNRALWLRTSALPKDPLFSPNWNIIYHDHSRMHDFWETVSPSDLSLSKPGNLVLAEWLSHWALQAYKQGDYELQKQYSKLAILLVPEWDTYYLAMAELELKHLNIENAAAIIQICEQYPTAAKGCQDYSHYQLSAAAILSQLVSQTTHFDVPVSMNNYLSIVKLMANHKNINTSNIPLLNEANALENLNQETLTRWRERLNGIKWSMNILDDSYNIARITYLFGLDAARSHDRIAEQLFMISNQLEPEWSMFHIELANYYWINGDYLKALNQINTCSQLQYPGQECEQYKQQYFIRGKSVEVGSYEQRILQTTISPTN